MFDQLTERMLSFYRRCSAIPEEQKICIIYEHIVKLKNKFELLDLLGFTEWQNYLNPDDYEFNIPEKQALSNQLEFFINKNEILDWYYSSPFATITNDLK
ncbi:MAG: hypothetical protein HC836_22695 [Richelia sp. RM2_1_2]|nr:hypothetical protein [Richelia sp. RM2_1_2]